MDWRLALLLHCPLGLKISSLELDELVRSQMPIHSPHQVADFVKNPRGQAYLKQNPNWSEASNTILRRSREHGIYWTYPYQCDYPQAWLHLSVRPAIMSYRGTPVWMHNKALFSVVGSRTPRPDTILWMQRELSAFLEARDLVVVSGGARGVDQWAHRIAIDSGRPTICVFPTGLLNPYPLEAKSLWEKILQHKGCLVSTFALEQPLYKALFAIRNRWITGLSRALFVVEGNRRSGSLLTGKLAFDENRTVCTLPVFPLCDQGLGNLDLLEQGALMIRDHRDLVTLFDRELSPGFT